MLPEEIEVRLRLLEDIESIKKLKAKYGYFVDAGNWEAVADLFTDGAVADYGPLLDSGPSRHYEGKAEIAGFFRDILTPSRSFQVHMFHNPIIEVKGEEATGKWYFDGPVTFAPTNKALWMAGEYQDEYMKVDGAWKFKTLICKLYYRTPYDEGWVKKRMYG